MLLTQGKQIYKKMNIRNSIQALKDEITAYRHELHRNPQTAYEETYASTLIQEKLTEWGIDFDKNWAVTGVVATIEGAQNTSGKTIALRADIDALDILEEDNKPHVSQTPGKMHGCGHDGHTAMLLGAAKYLSENRNFDGKIHLIFQPAEEGAGGAYKMIDEGLFDTYQIDEIYGLHNWPLIPRGQIAMRAGPIMAAADRFDINIIGKGGHAAAPYVSIDPIIIGTQIVTALQTLISRSIHYNDSAVISITNFNAGTGAFNVIPENGHLSGTLRTFDQDLRETLKRRIAEISQDTAKLYGGSATCEFDPGGYAPTVNSAAETTFCGDVAESLVSAENLDRNVDPVMGAEDFGAYLLQKPGCFIFMGQAEPDSPESNCNNMVHTPQYDFNDDIIPLGIEYWVRLAETAMPLSK